MRSILRSIFPWSNFSRNGGSILNRYQHAQSIPVNCTWCQHVLHSLVDQLRSCATYSTVQTETVRADSRRMLPSHHASRIQKMMKITINAHQALLEAPEGRIWETVWYFYGMIVINIYKTKCYYTKILHLAEVLLIWQSRIRKDGKPVLAISNTQ